MVQAFDGHSNCLSSLVVARPCSSTSSTARCHSPARSRCSASGLLGFEMINKSTMGHLKFAPLGNTATHLPMGLDGIPGMTHVATSKGKSIAELDVPEVPDFLELTDGAQLLFI